jgi:hypothetical protein
VLARHAVSIDNPLDDEDAHLRNLKAVTSAGFRKDEVVYSSPLGLRATVLGESTGMLQVMLHPFTRATLFDDARLSLPQGRYPRSRAG